jgi:hypothetical protein
MVAAMIRIEFWGAGRLGRGWLRVSPRLREQFAEMPAICDAIGRGEQVPARRTLSAQDFAWRVWGRSGMAVLLLAFPVIAVAAALHPGRSGAHWAAAIVGVLGCLALLGWAVMAMLTYRASCAGSYLRHSSPGAGAAPLPQSVSGRYSRYDFWLALAPIVAFGVFLLSSNVT